MDNNSPKIYEYVFPVKRMYFDNNKNKVKTYLVYESHTIIEEWKELYFRGKPSGYLISNIGEVRKPDGSISPLYYDKDGYTRFCLYIPKNHPIYKNNKRIAYPYKTHRAVAELFVTNANPSENDIVMHLNDVPDCNVYLNLQWGTAQDNMDYKKNSGRSRYLRGEEKSDSLFSEKDAKDICEMIYIKGLEKKSDIIMALGYQDRDDIFLKSFKNLIKNIKSGHCWKYIRDRYK